MTEVIKLIIKILLKLTTGIRRGALGNQLVPPNPRREKYDSADATVSRITDFSKDEMHTAVRVPSPIKNKFSIFLPSTLSTVQYARIVEDVQCRFFEMSVKRSGIAETKQVRPLIMFWDSNQDLADEFVHDIRPFLERRESLGISAVHADGDYIRILCSGSVAQQSALPVEQVKREIDELAEKLRVRVSSLKVKKPARRSIKLRTILRGLGILGFMASGFLLVVLGPTFTLLREPGWTIWAFFGGWALLGLAMFLKLKRDMLKWPAFKFSISVSVLVVMILASYIRFADYYFGSRNPEEAVEIVAAWPVVVKGKTSKTKYNVRFKNQRGGVYPAIAFSRESDKAMLPVIGSPARIGTKTGLLGMNYIDAACVVQDVEGAAAAECRSLIVAPFF